VRFSSRRTRPDAELPPARLLRAERLIAAIRKAGLSKYNIDARADVFSKPEDGRPVILVPGQVEDDASVRLGAGAVAGNLDLLRAARRLHPDGFVVYKPHPDVEAGLRKGAVPMENLVELADHVAIDASPIALLSVADRVVTLTSGLGFEAMIRNVPVTVLGAPFYAGWGLSTDLGNVPQRRRARPSLEGLVHAAMIAYPRYHDPVTDMPCPPEIVVARLQSGEMVRPSRSRSLLARLQAWRGAIRIQFWG